MKRNSVKSAIVPLAMLGIAMLAFFSGPTGGPVPQLDNQITLLENGNGADSWEDNLLDEFIVGVASAGCSSECVISVCVNWKPGPSPQCPVPGPGGGCCLAYGPGCKPNCPSNPPPVPTATPIPPTPIPIPPSVKGAVSCDSFGNAGWCIGNAVLSMTANDPQGNPVTIQGTIGGYPFVCVQGNSCTKPLPEGSGKVSFWATSASGRSPSGSDLWRRDTRNPILSASMPSVDGENGWYISAVSANLSAFDSVSGIASTGIRVDGGAVQAAPVALSEGVYALTFVAIDAAGHQTLVNQRVSIDMTDPGISVGETGTQGDDNWYISDLDLVVSGSDALSGYASGRVSANGNAPVNDALSLSDGVYSIEYLVKDIAGNSTLRTRDYKVDASAPGVTAKFLPVSPDGENGWYTVSVNADLSATDSVSGIQSTSISVNGGGFQAAPVNLLDGVFTVDFLTVNGAGLSRTIQRTVSVDSQPPVLSPSVPAVDGQNGWHRNDVLISLDAQDAISGLDYKSIIVDGSNRSNPTILSDGEYVVEFLAKDNAGLFTQTLTNIYVDTIDPLAIFVESGADGESGWYITDANVSVQSSDAGSGVYAIAYQIDGGVWLDGNATTLEEGVFNARFRVTDRAGNESFVEKTMRVDKTPPVSNFTSHASGALVSREVHLSGESLDAISGPYSSGEILIDNGAGGAIWSPLVLNVAGEWSQSWNTYLLPNGAYTHLMRTRDVAGNQANTVTITLRVNNEPPSVGLRPGTWNISKSGTLTVSANGIPVDTLTLIYRDPKGICPKRTISLRPDITKTSVKWDRRCGDGSYAESGDYEVVAIVCDVHGNCSKDISEITIPWYASPPEIEATFTATPTSTSTPLSTLAPTNITTNTPAPYIAPTPTQTFFVSETEPSKKALKLDLRKVSGWMVALATLLALGLLTIDPRPSALRELEILGDQWMAFSRQKE